MNSATSTFTTMNTYQGSNSDPITLHKYLYANAKYPNNSTMKRFENKVKKTVALGENVLLIVKPFYCNDTGVPLYLSFVAFGECGFNFIGLIPNIK